MGIRSFRLEERLDKELSRTARGEGTTKTAVIHEALAAYLAAKRRQKRFLSVAEAMKEFIAAGSRGTKNLSVGTSSQVLEILREKKRAGRL
jgi:predicted transcriptional regulator